MIGTGNFHARNARLYEDFGLFTTDPEIGEEVASLFNTLTGYGHPEPQAKTLVAPTWMRKPLIAQIEQTAKAYADGDQQRPDRDEDELARRSQGASARCTRRRRPGCRSTSTSVASAAWSPACPGVSESISVVSVVGRFLEHSRIYSFHRGDEHVYYIGSADLMPRNLDTRVELLTPVDAPELKSELQDTLDRCLADDTYSWTLDSERNWTRRTGRTRAVHQELMERTLERAAAIANSDT